MLFALIFYFVGFGKVLSVLLSAKPELLLLAALAYLALNLVMSYRILVVLANLGHRLDLYSIFPSNLAGMLASDFTPARAGYFFTAFSLSSRFKISLEKTVLSIFGPQLFDFLIKATSAGLVMFLLLSKAGVENLWLNLLFLVMILGSIVAAALLVFYPPLLAALVFLEKLPLVPKIFNFLRTMHQHSDSVLAVKWKIIGITLLSWAVKGLEWLLLAHAIGIRLSDDLALEFIFMMVFQGAVTILQFLPLPTIAGAGASEAGFAAILLPFGIPLESSVTFGFLTRLLMISVDAFSLPVILGYLKTHTLEKSLEGISEIEQ